MRALRSRLSYSNVVATLALFLALGGGAVAALNGKLGSKRIKTNAVKSRHIAPSAVKSPDVGPNAVTGADVLETSLGGVPLALNAEAVDGSSREEITRRIEFVRTNVASANNVPLGTIGDVDLQASCSDDGGGNAVLTVTGIASGGSPGWESLFTSLNGTGVTFEEDFGAFAPADQTLFVSGPALNGTYWLTYGGLQTTVAIQARYEISEAAGLASCELEGTAAIG